MKLGKRTKIALMTVGVVLVAQTVTYLLFADRAVPAAVLRSLGDRELLRAKRFALVPQETWDALSQSQRDALTCELKRHVTVIYCSEHEVPMASLYTRATTEEDIERYERWKREGYVMPGAIEQQKRAIDRGCHTTGYRDGVRLSWKPAWHVPFAMKGTVSSWVSGTGAEWRCDVYIWLFGWWVRVWNMYRAQA